MSKKNKILIFVTLLLLVVLTYFSYIIYNKKINNKIAKIYQDGKLIYEINLDKVEEAYTIKIDGDKEHYNIVEVRKGEIGIIEASCPDKVCVNMGFVSDGLLPITCLPNKLIIEIEGGEESAYDVQVK
jgi:hypothetical protein